MKQEKRGLLIICGESVEINGGCSLTRLVFFDMMKKYSNMPRNTTSSYSQQTKRSGIRQSEAARGME